MSMLLRLFDRLLHLYLFILWSKEELEGGVLYLFFPFIILGCMNTVHGYNECFRTSIADSIHNF